MPHFHKERPWGKEVPKSSREQDRRYCYREPATCRVGPSGRASHPTPGRAPKPQQASSSPRNYWQSLPTELRVLVLHNIMDLPTFRNILVASLPDRDIYCRYAYEFQDRIIEAFAPGIQDSIWSILSCRQQSAIQPAALTRELKAHIRHKRWPPRE